MGRNGGIDKLHTQHAILDPGKQVAPRFIVGARFIVGVGGNTVPAGENSLGSARPGLSTRTFVPKIIHGS